MTFVLEFGFSSRYKNDIHHRHVFSQMHVKYSHVHRNSPQTRLIFLAASVIPFFYAAFLSSSYKLAHT